MKMHAGSLYKNYLVLYAENVTPVCIQVDDQDTQWDIYCSDVDVELAPEMSQVIYKGKEFYFPYVQTDSPMHTLGFA